MQSWVFYRRLCCNKFRLSHQEPGEEQSHQKFLRIGNRFRKQKHASVRCSERVEQMFGIWPFFLSVFALMFLKIVFKVILQFPSGDNWNQADQVLFSVDIIYPLGLLKNC